MKITLHQKQRNQAKKQISEKLLKNIHASLAVQAVVEDSPDVVQTVLEAMLEEGEIAMAGIFADGDSQDGHEGETEAEFDDDLEMDDEDGYVEEREPSVEFDDFSSPFVGDAFDIMVYSQNGRMRVEAPENPWSGAVGVTMNAQSALLACSKRIKAYEIIVERLERVFDGKSFSLEDALGRMGSQRVFAKEHGLDAGSLSRYLKNARLVFEDHSVPLRKLFS